MQSINIEEIRHQKSWNVPVKAIRETIINALVHADYSQLETPVDDRIYIVFGSLAEPFVQDFWDNTQDHKDDILNFVNGRKNDGEPSSSLF